MQKREILFGAMSDGVCNQRDVFGLGSDLLPQARIIKKLLEVSFSIMRLIWVWIKQETLALNPADAGSEDDTDGQVL